MASKNTKFWKKLAMKRSQLEETENMACEICLTKFTFFKKRKECIECRGECCSSCVVKEQGRQTCKRCRILMAVPPDPSALMRLKAKDLKQYLCRKHISHQGCTQKDELVDLVLQVTLNAGRPRPTAASPPPHSVNSRNAAPDTSASSSSLHEPAPPSTATQGSPSSGSPQNSPFHGTESSTAENENLEPSQSATSQENVNETPLPTQQSGQRYEDLLSSLKSEEAINGLTVRQLKLILLRHFVDYKGCCEKLELQDRVRRLWRQHKETKNIDPDTLSNEQLCKICWELPINCVLLECGHMATCTECGKQMNECPICRQYVVRVVHTFRA